MNVPAPTPPHQEGPSNHLRKLHHWYHVWHLMCDVYRKQQEKTNNWRSDFSIKMLQNQCEMHVKCIETRGRLPSMCHRRYTWLYMDHLHTHTYIYISSSYHFFGAVPKMWGTSMSINGNFHSKPSILGYLHLWKPPYLPEIPVNLPLETSIMETSCNLYLLIINHPAIGLPTAKGNCTA